MTSEAARSEFYLARISSRPDLIWHDSEEIVFEWAKVGRRLQFFFDEADDTFLTSEGPPIEQMKYGFLTLEKAVELVDWFHNDD